MENYKKITRMFFLVLTAIVIAIFLTSCVNKNLNAVDPSEETTTQSQSNIENDETTVVTLEIVTENDTTETTSEIITDSEKEDIVCSLIQENGNYYIQISGTDIKDDQINNMELVPYIVFDNVQNFVNTVKNNSYTEKQLQKLSEFDRVDGKIPICDLENIYYPTISNEYASESYVYWYGETYLWFLNYENQNIMGCITPTTSEKYLNQDMFRDKIMNEYKVIDCEVTEDGKNYIYLNAITYVTYTLYKENTEITVAKCYYIEDNAESAPFKPNDDTIPRDVYVFVKEGSFIYVFILESFVSNVTDETILSIGLEKYILPEDEIEVQPESIIE